jgi:hypothetical protein
MAGEASPNTPAAQANLLLELGGYMNLLKRLLPLLLLAALAAPAQLREATSSPGVPMAVQHQPNFADAEIVSGSGKTWSLKHAPAPTDSLLLFVDLPGWGAIPLLQSRGDYSIHGNRIITSKSYEKGALHSWYRY